MHTTTFNHVGSIGPTQHPHQAQMQHENLMKVLQIQVSNESYSNIIKYNKKRKIIIFLNINYFYSNNRNNIINNNSIQICYL